MSINRLTRKRTNCTIDSRNYHIMAVIDPDPYPEEDAHCKKGKKRRSYRTWKHNRDNQWK
jgi:hypothetical protein